MVAQSRVQNGAQTTFRLGLRELVSPQLAARMREERFVTMTHDEHHDQPDDQPQDQPQDTNGDDFEFEIDPLDITPYQPGAGGIPDEPEPEDTGAETIVPGIPVPPAADESVPVEPTPPRVPVFPTAEDAAPSDGVPEADVPADGVPAVPISETFTGDVFGALPADRDAGRDSVQRLPDDRYD